MLSIALRLAKKSSEFAASDEELAKTQAGRQTKAAGQCLHLLLHCDLRLTARIAKRGHDKIFENFTFVWLN
jgi:hypothetical protein